MLDIETELRRSFGGDLMRIDGIKIMTAQLILRELGPDWISFPSESRFAGWRESESRTCGEFPWRGTKGWKRRGALETASSAFDVAALAMSGLAIHHKGPLRRAL